MNGQPPPGGSGPGVGGHALPPTVKWSAGIGAGIGVRLPAGHWSAGIPAVERGGSERRRPRHLGRIIRGGKLGGSCLLGRCLDRLPGCESYEGRCCSFAAGDRGTFGCRGDNAKEQHASHCLLPPRTMERG